MIADKLGLEILQCGIDYFIGLKNVDDEAPNTAMKMLKYAKSIVIGKIAKARCDDQINELQKFIDDLPPKEVLKEDRAIKIELESIIRLAMNISNAVRLINNTKSYLQTIKQKLGQNNDYYLKMSTQIIGIAMHFVVEEVNAVQKSDTIEIQGIPLNLDSIMTPEQRLQKLNKIKATVREAWKATTLMDEFDLEPQFKSHYNQNRSTLKSMCSDLGISTYVSRPSATSRPVLKPTTTKSSTSNTTQSRPSTAYTSTSSNKANKVKKEINPIVAVIIVHLIWGTIFVANGGNFLAGMFVGAFGWLFYVNFIAYAIIDWIYEKITE